MLYAFTVSLVFLNLNRFSIIKIPFLSAELKNITQDALATKEELELSIVESKDQIKKIEKKVKDVESMAIVGL